MTKKDYKLIASALIECGTWYSDGTTDPTYLHIVHAISSKLRNDNPNFKPLAFYNDCGLKRDSKRHAWVLND